VPGWLYQVKKGATTIWERWDAIQADGSIYNPQMNSYNHYAYGAVCQWLFEGVAGFQPDASDPGFATVIFAPTIIAELSPVAASHDSVNGAIRAGWTLDGNQVRYDIEVPQGARGVLRLPVEYRDVTVDDQPHQSGADRELAAGPHHVTFTYEAPAHAAFAKSRVNARTP
jgi:alpha-L-rhamnosidase